MPVSLNKIRKLQSETEQVKPDETSRYRRPKKNSPAYWQVKVKGKKWGVPFDSQEEALKYIDNVGLRNLLPSIERISKDEFNRNRDPKTKS